MGQEYSMEVVERAEELYCVDGHTFDAVATLTGVAVSTLKRWSERYGWQEKKDEIRQAMSSIRLNKIRLRANLIGNCLTTLNAQDAFAVASMETLALKAAAQARKTDSVSQGESASMREIKTDTDAVAALEEAVQMKLNIMLANPGQVRLAAVKEVKETLALLSEMRARVEKHRLEAHATTEDKRLDPETLKKVREQIYGVA